MSEVSEDLARRIEALSEKRVPIDPREIVEVVESVMTSISGDLSTVNVKLYAEVEALANFIVSAKAEIASLRPEEIKDEHLPSATDQLDAIVDATETATNTIFEAIEKIEELAEKMDADTAEKVNSAITSVYEACSFQDITGQRISKVVSALRHIDAKLEALVEAFGNEFNDVPRPESKDKPKRIDGKPERPDEHLMNGPQLPENASSQDEIDALFDFD